MSKKLRLVELFNAIQNLREYKKADLARKLGTSETSIGKWVDPRSPALPAMENMDAIAGFVGLELPSSHPLGWIQTLDDLNAYLEGRDAAPPISPKQALRLISMSEDVAVLCEIATSAIARVKFLATPETPSDNP